jgi:hypothetical protein
MVAGKATDHISGRLREARGLINDSPQAAVFRFAQRIGLLGIGAQAPFQVAFPRRRRPYLPGTTVRRRRLDWAEDHWCAWGHERTHEGLFQWNARGLLGVGARALLQVAFPQGRRPLPPWHHRPGAGG